MDSPKTGCMQAPNDSKEKAAARCQQASPRRHKPMPRVAHGATNPLGIALRRSTEQPKCFSCLAHPLFFIKVIWSGTVVFNKPCTVLLTPVAAFAGLPVQQACATGAVSQCSARSFVISLLPVSARERSGLRSRSKPAWSALGVGFAPRACRRRTTPPPPTAFSAVRCVPFCGQEGSFFAF